MHKPFAFFIFYNTKKTTRHSGNSKIASQSVKDLTIQKYIFFLPCGFMKFVLTMRRHVYPEIDISVLVGFQIPSRTFFGRDYVFLVGRLAQPVQGTCQMHLLIQSHNCVIPTDTNIRTVAMNIILFFFILFVVYLNPSTSSGTRVYSLASWSPLSFWRGEGGEAPVEGLTSWELLRPGRRCCLPGRAG